MSEREEGQLKGYPRGAPVPVPEWGLGYECVDVGSQSIADHPVWQLCRPRTRDIGAQAELFAHEEPKGKESWIISSAGWKSVGMVDDPAMERLVQWPGQDGSLTLAPHQDR